MCYLDLGPDLFKPVGSVKCQNRFILFAEIQWPLPAIELSEMGLMLDPPLVQRGFPEVAGALKLHTREADRIVLTEYLGHTGC